MSTVKHAPAPQKSPEAREPAYLSDAADEAKHTASVFETPKIEERAPVEAPPLQPASEATIDTQKVVVDSIGADALNAEVPSAVPLAMTNLLPQTLPPTVTRISIRFPRWLKCQAGWPAYQACFRTWNRRSKLRPKLNWRRSPANTVQFRNPYQASSRIRLRTLSKLSAKNLPLMPRPKGRPSPQNGQNRIC